MRTFTAPLYELGEFEEITKLLSKPQAAVSLIGCVDSQKLHMAYGLSEGFKYKIIVTYNDLRAKAIYEDCKLYDKNVTMYPAKDLIFYQADIHGNQIVTERIKALRRVIEGRPLTVVTTFDSFMTPQVPLSVLEKNVIRIDCQASVNERELAGKLVEMGYEKNYQVEAPGQFSIRGGIVDIFDLTEENPYRIELWGEEVESIRSFDILSQRSIEKLQSICIYPATEMVLTAEEMKKGIERIEAEAKKCGDRFRKEFKTEEAHRITSQIKELKEQILEFKEAANLESYIRYFYPETVSFMELFDKDKSCIFIDEPARVKEHADAVELEFRESMMHRMEKGYALPGQADILFGSEEVAARMAKNRAVTLAAMDLKNSLFKADKKFDIGAKSVASYNNSFEALLKDLKRYKKSGYRVLLLSGSRTRAKRLAEDLRNEELTSFYSDDSFREIQPGEVMTFYGRAQKGFEYPLIKFVVISESDIFGAEKKKKRKVKKYEGQKINGFNDLKVGDYVVHENHGLGIYKGIEKVEVEKVVKDYIKIEYRDGGNLYILATGLDVIQKYASADAKRPKLNKLGTQEWSRTKSKVKGAVNEVAKDLVELYAVRQQKEGFIYGKDTVWQQEFEEMFPYEETEDQMTAIAATKKDMESTKIMDRLICGDVGYGKTEIAIRAAFKAVQEGKQVVYLVPTTILAQQHYNTFVQRMKDFPVRVDLLSRFRTSTEQKKTAEDLRKGLVDIVIGTHRVLSKDVVFKDLGLLIIDEEQRFGVAHKEKIKKMKENVDVLTLTATPIPRTLHMSLIGIRDMSVLEEAPEDRLPIQTYVLEYNEEMVREAIVRELSRDGQVYYVYNRVNNIADVASGIAELVPEANVAFAHGQMKEHELEKIMYDFIGGEIDVLVSTTIIETGLDISNVNTMIIHDSDNMGLSQLYQLRGRVGRSNRTAYAFLMYKRDKMLKEIAEKRLAAIKEFTDLGSGFKIAMRDLEIRGAGNLLGSKQHGHMQAVGYDLYCKMLNEAVKNLKGMKTQEDFNTSVDLDVDAFIPPSYIVNEFQKLDIYKRIAGIDNRGESDDMKEELLDRFGEIPKSVDNLLRIALVRVNAHKLYMPEVRGQNGEIRFLLNADAKIKAENIPALLKKYSKLTFNAKGVPFFLFRYKKCAVVEKDAENLLTLTEELLADMNEILLEESTVLD
ncbi:transcription-repair coupling factor [Kineothrix alysoides]|uniref:Transcription-repair-coupling factor n=1 Tax=Kineothrix alysoides TaxID=1469948 RepID=A0A4R1R6B3_9FIRM|nr:transcription-repair coupling factor [Kineothrix alysoides]TCL61048.1 transcription-repair coupling factor [Kineothrix alysoides]